LTEAGGLHAQVFGGGPLGPVFGVCLVHHPPSFGSDVSAHPLKDGGEGGHLVSVGELVEGVPVNPVVVVGVQFHGSSSSSSVSSISSVSPPTASAHPWPSSVRWSGRECRTWGSSFSAA